jgi:hypothetical protein
MYPGRGNVGYWHEADIKLRPLFGRFGVEIGHHRLIASISAFDPTETWAAQDFRSAKALFVPSLKRDIVPLLRDDLRREGSLTDSCASNTMTWRQKACKKLIDESGNPDLELLLATTRQSLS